MSALYAEYQNYFNTLPYVVVLTKEPFVNVVVSLLSVRNLNPTFGQAEGISFDYEILRVPEGFDESSTATQEFHDLIGGILFSILEAHYDNAPVESTIVLDAETNEPLLDPTGVEVDASTGATTIHYEAPDKERK